MIAIVTNMSSGFGRGTHEGVISYAMDHWRTGWKSVVSVPWDIAVRGLADWQKYRGIIVQEWSKEGDIEIASSGVPAVNVSGCVDDCALPAVLPNDYMAGERVAEYFLKRGYRSFAYYPAPCDLGWSTARGTGFTDAVRTAGHSVSWYGDYPTKLPQGAVRAYGQATSWLRGLPKPTALLACHDHLAADMCGIAAAAGISVPEQISIVGIDDDPSAHYAQMGISSVALPAHRIGYDAAALLDSLMAGEKPEQRVYRIDVQEVITRTSSDCLAMDDPDVLDAVKYIREYATRGIEVSDVAKAVAISRRTLERRFRAVIGSSPKDEIRRVQIERAKHLLSKTRMSVHEIAQAVGIGDRSLLSTTIKAATGLSPAHFRANHSQKNSSVTRWHAIATSQRRRGSFGADQALAECREYIRSGRLAKSE